MTATHTSHEVKLKPRTKDVLIEENLEFRGLFLSANIQEGLTKHGFVRPSPIQLKAIPLGRCGLDLIIQAKSGTGKTCVFSVIALDGILLDSLGTQVLVLAPTREIAVQICEVVNNIGCCMPGLKCLTFIGGTPLSEDRLKLARCHIAIGTPGRIKQLIEEKLLKTSSIRLFVLDEADKLLEDSFQEQVNWVFSSLPDNKQMLALSATYPEVLAQHLTAYMRNPTFLRLNITDPALLGIRQYYRSVSYNPLVNKLFDSKTDALLELLSSVEFHQCLIFSNYQMRAESLSEVLNFRGWPATYISGSREQEDRMAAMKSLKQMTCRVLISTDLTSRGIDAENVNLVVNLDLPPNHETYLHRIGRAGRFGTYGAGVSFVSEGKEMDEMHRLEKLCHTTIKPLPEPIPCDLARSSGFVSLEHLVTTETIITKKEAVTILPTKPLLISPMKPQSEATILGKSRLSESASDVDGSKESGSNGNIPKESGSHGDGPKESGSNGNIPKESGSHGDGPKESGSNGDGPKESGSNGDGLKESGSNGDCTKESGSNGDCTKESESNGDVPNESGSNGDGPKKSVSDRDSYSEANRSHVVVKASMVTGVNENGKCESDNVSECRNASIIQSSEGKTRRKVNNVWTSLSFIYGEECKDMEDKRAKGTLVNATAKDNHRKPSPRKSASGRKSAEHKQSSQNEASSCVAVIDGTVGKGDTDPGVPLAALKNAGARTTVPTLPSLQAFTGPSATLPTYADLLADYDDYMAEYVCDQVFLTQNVDQETTFDTNYTDYLNSVYKLLQDLAEHVKVQERTQVKMMLGNGDAVAEFVEVAQALVGHHEELLAVCATHKTEGLQLGDVEPTKEANEGMQSKDCEKKRSESGHSLRQLTSEQMLRNYAMLRDERLCTQADFQEKEQKKSDTVDTGVKLSQFAKNSKPTWSKRKKYASPYGPWQPYIPPEYEAKEETDVDEEIDTDEDDTDELDGEEESETDWESSSLDDVDLGKEPCSISRRCQSSRNPPSGSSRHPIRSTDQGHGPTPPMGQGFYPPPTTHDFYAHPPAYGYYPPSPSAYGHYPPPPSAYGQYPPPPSAYGQYPPPPSAYGQYPPPPSADGQPTSPPLSAHAHYTPPWSTHAYYPASGEVPSAPDMAFQNMMHAQQNMLFTTTCYHQYMMHLQQADFFKRMLQSQHALSNADSLYREQERYIRKMAKWMAQSKK